MPKQEMSAFVTDEYERRAQPDLTDVIDHHASDSFDRLDMT